MQAYEQDIELLINSANRRLSELLQREELPLVTGGTRTLEDRLWVWGIVGGKEVGKSTLINALAGGDVVGRGAAVGEGTFRPEAYLSADDVRAFRSRFTDTTKSTSSRTRMTYDYFSSSAWNRLSRPMSLSGRSCSAV